MKMRLTRSPLEKAEAELEEAFQAVKDAEAEVASRQLALELQRNEPVDQGDLEAWSTHQDKIANSELRILRAKAFAKIQRAKLAEAEKNREAKQFDARYEAAAIAQPAISKLISKNFELISQVAANIKRIDENYIEVSAINIDLADRQDMRPRIADAEYLARSKPGRVLAERFETIEVWATSDGEEPTIFMNWNGETVPATIVDGVKEPVLSGRYQKRKKRVCAQTANVVPPSMPERIASVTRLVDVDGTQVWPPK